MKFGKLFRRHLERTLPQWRCQFLRYKLLKKLLKNIPLSRENIPFPWFHDWFVGLLFGELEKFNDFYVEKEEDFIIQFQTLEERIKLVKDERNRGVFFTENEFKEKMMVLRKNLVALHGKMVLLKSYSSLNFAGLIKILKKYDKRTGLSLTQPFAQLVLTQPFFMTEPLSRLVRECEENIENLIPQEPEVIDSDHEQTDDAEDADVSKPSYDATAFLLGEDNVDIYWSTVAAMSAIQNLKRGSSSTYNPLSMSYVFGKKDDDSMGSVTAENSPCNSDIDDDDDEGDDMGSP